ncbi:MAG: hypothetical protein LBU65_09600 [Planctomycetaceae bacterium]|jgi:hypothetical protein|nr:hypothetical protein [Planctomycetaceae bacterium]
MKENSIPDWDEFGVLPAYDIVEGPASVKRSPYVVSLIDVVRRFAISPERIKILDEFLKFRKRLTDKGLVNGFQWVNGSFIEDVERLRQRPPKDLDVVTFLELPDAESQQTFDKYYQEVVGSDRIIDARIVPLPPTITLDIITEFLYWSGMWSHCRDSKRWKGFLQIGLNPKEDIDARLDIELIKKGEVKL